MGTPVPGTQWHQAPCNARSQQCWGHRALGPIGVGHQDLLVLGNLGIGAHWHWAPPGHWGPWVLGPTVTGNPRLWALGPITLDTRTCWCWAPPWASGTGTHWDPRALGPTGVAPLDIGHPRHWEPRTHPHWDLLVLGIARTPGPTSSEHPRHWDQHLWASRIRMHRQWALRPPGGTGTEHQHHPPVLGTRTYWIWTLQSWVLGTHRHWDPQTLSTGTH